MKQSVTLIICAQSTAVIDHVKQAITDLCTTECPDVVLDSDDDQEVIMNLTQTEVIHNESLAVFILCGDIHYYMATRISVNVRMVMLCFYHTNSIIVS